MSLTFLMYDKQNCCSSCQILGLFPTFLNLWPPHDHPPVYNNDDIGINITCCGKVRQQSILVAISAVNALSCYWVIISWWYLRVIKRSATRVHPNTCCAMRVAVLADLKMASGRTEMLYMRRRMWMSWLVVLSANNVCKIWGIYGGGFSVLSDSTSRQSYANNRSGHQELIACHIWCY